jgi:hypothetical protein
MAQRWGGDFSGMPQKPEGNAQDQYYVKIQDYVELIEPEDAIA